MMEDSPNSQTKHWGSTSEEILRTNFPLHRACRDGDTEALSMLLIQAQHGVYVEDSFYGWTPAHWSAYFGKLDCLRKLMSITRVGADCNIKTSRFDQTPAHFAAFGGHPRCLLWLVMASADLDAQDYLGETPLHKAARSGSMECVSLLVSHGAKLFIRNHNGMTSSQLASTCGHAECSKSLEAAALRSEEHCRSQGIYREQVIQPHLGQPSPHDVTTNGADPRLTVSGGSVQNIPSGLATGVMNGGSEDCEMDEDVSPSNNMLNGFASPPNTPAPFNANGDVTLSTAISSNQAPVAGRKRCREDTEETEYKRMRKNDVQGNLPLDRSIETETIFANEVSQHAQKLQEFAGLNGLKSNPSNTANMCGDMNASAIEHQHTIKMEDMYNNMLHVVHDYDVYHGN